MTERLCVTLRNIADTSDIVRIDELFAQLTIGVICEAAFDMDMSAFEGAENDCSFYGQVLRDVFKYSWLRMVPFSFLLYHLPVPPFTLYKAARTHYLRLRVQIYEHIRSVQNLK